MPNHNGLLPILVVLASAVISSAVVGQAARPTKPPEKKEAVKRTAKQQEMIKELAAREHISEAEAAEILKKAWRGESTRKDTSPSGRKRTLKDYHSNPSGKTNLRTIQGHMENERGSEEHDRNKHANRGCNDLPEVQRKRCLEEEEKKSAQGPPHPQSQ